MYTTPHTHLPGRSVRDLLAALLAAVLGIATLSTGHAALPAPTGKVLLRISGAIAEPNVGNEAHLDLALLQSLPTAEFTTTTPWSGDDLLTFRGVRIDALLEAVGADPMATFTANALDKYSAVFGGVDVVRYPVIIAYEENGSSISVRQLGPLRIMFPFDDYPELLNTGNHTMSVWQLIEMVVH